MAHHAIYGKKRDLWILSIFPKGQEGVRIRDRRVALSPTEDTIERIANKKGLGALVRIVVNRQGKESWQTKWTDNDVDDMVVAFCQEAEVEGLECYQMILKAGKPVYNGLPMER